jgi:hypothetical protein
MYRILLACILVSLMVNIGQAKCVQDQVGNQYEFYVDPAHHYLYGEMRSAQGCDAPVWYLIGAWVPAGGTKYELTASNPLGDADTHCVPVYKIKGLYPNGAWYYTEGYGDQEFQFVPCGSVVEGDSEAGGALK